MTPEDFTLRHLGLLVLYRRLRRLRRVANWASVFMLVLPLCAAMYFDLPLASPLGAILAAMWLFAVYALRRQVPRLGGWKYIERTVKQGTNSLLVDVLVDWYQLEDSKEKLAKMVGQNAGLDTHFIQFSTKEMMTIYLHADKVAAAWIDRGGPVSKPIFFADPMHFDLWVANERPSLLCG